jgi:hypothetical protein
VGAAMTEIELWVESENLQRPDCLTGTVPRGGQGVSKVTRHMVAGRW